MRRGPRRYRGAMPIIKPKIILVEGEVEQKLEYQTKLSLLLVGHAHRESGMANSSIYRLA